MAKNYYPIINNNCKVCLACVVSCPKGVLVQEHKQIILKDSSKCIEGCKACQTICSYNAISYYDGSQESLLKAFSGSCNCSNH